MVQIINQPPKYKGQNGLFQKSTDSLDRLD